MAWQVQTRGGFGFSDDEWLIANNDDTYDTEAEAANVMTTYILGDYEVGQEWPYRIVEV